MDFDEDLDIMNELEKLEITEDDLDFSDPEPLTLNMAEVRMNGHETSMLSPQSPGEAFRDLKLRKNCGEILLSRYQKNLTAIVDNDDRECFILDLDKKMTPPKELDEVISRYFSGYYMPKVSVIRNDYVVVQPPVTDLTFAGPFIAADCLHYDTYRLEKRIMPREIIEIRFECKTYGYSDMKTLVKDSIFK